MVPRPVPVPNRRNLPPPPRLTIPVKIRAGQNLSETLNGLEPLDHKTAAMDVEMSWVDAIEYYFNFQIDPDKYLVQKGPRRLGLQGGRHSLHEKIKVLVSLFPDYNNSEEEFLVQLVYRNKLIQELQPQPSNHRRRLIELSKKRPLPPPPPAKRTTLEPATAEEEENYEEVVRHRHDNRRDLKSTRESLDLHMGIPWEDLQGNILQKIRDNYRTSDFLRAREELRSLKNNGRWTRALMTIPSVLNIAEDLFDAE